MEANWSRYRLAAASSGRFRSSKAAQYSSRKRQISSHIALRADADCPIRPYLMVRSISSWKRLNALAARPSLPASRALYTREVSLPMLAICCGKESSAQRPFSNEACCIYSVINCSTIALMDSRTFGSITSREGFPCQERMLMSESNSMKSSPSSSTQRLTPHKSSCAEPSSSNIRSRSACKSASSAKSIRLTSATHFIISPNVFCANALSSVRVTGC